jgi:hypothetical protein
MQVFISWSGEPSRMLAELLYRWLPQVVQELEPWLSSKDIDKGQLWDRILSERLSIHQGIVCVTRGNTTAPWLNFESGALAKSVGEAAVRPLLLDLLPADLKGPLTRFQSTVATSEPDMLELLRSLNVACERRITDELLAKTFKNAWPAFRDELETILGGVPTEAKPHRDIEDMVGEVLERVREIQRQVGAVPGVGRPAESMPRMELTE